MDARHLGLVTVLAAALISGCSSDSVASTSTQPSVAPPDSIPNRVPAVSINNGPLQHLDVATVSGHGFTPNSDLVVAECADLQEGDRTIDVCDMSVFTAVQTDGEGRFEAALTVRAVIGVGQRLEADCGQAGCSVGVAYLQTDTVVALAEIEWDGTASAPPAPVLTLANLVLDDEPNTGSVDVTGTGFTPGAVVNLVQCPISTEGHGVDADDCLYDYGTTVTADSQGEIQVRAVVYPRFQRSTGELIECAVNPDVCVLGDPWPDDPTSRLTFTAFSKTER